MAMITSTSRIGTFAQYGIGTAVGFGSSGWLGYGRFDYRTGAAVVGYSFNAGLRYTW
jgi:outer membrane autotransporter protein